MKANVFSIKKLTCLLLALVVVFGGVTAVGAATKGFYFTYNKAKAVPGSNAASFIKAAGKASKTTKKNSCATKGYDYTYKYADFTLVTYTEKKTKTATQYVLSVEITSDKVKTPEGVTIGSSEAAVKKAYKGAKAIAGVYTATKGSSKVSIEVKDDKVTSIKILKK